MLNYYCIQHRLLTSITIFLIVYAGLILLSPKFCFDKEGNLLNFGLNYKNKTILPVWLLVIVIAILSYFFTYYYTHSVRYMY